MRVMTRWEGYREKFYLVYQAVRGPDYRYWRVDVGLLDSSPARYGVAGCGDMRPLTQNSFSLLQIRPCIYTLIIYELFFNYLITHN